MLSDVRLSIFVFNGGGMGSWVTVLVDTFQITFHLVNSMPDIILIHGVCTHFLRRMPPLIIGLVR